ncbi:sensor histidine kinase [Crocinitomicaceae bacterium]|nr:sensor histidine kinase [Crocinitomicaceae bacterium]|tara:strand:+ start:29085 stop:29444 length:360 start_codon:yes stop_codon:yes gene_type:complete
MNKTYTTIENMTHEESIAEFKTLKESNTRYREMFDSIVDVFTRVNNDDSIKLSNIDRGNGIPKGDLTNLFEPFYRASNVVEIMGAGLCTPITKESVELNTGTIQVNSNIDERSTFILKK